jgi:hypothetical protein
MALEFPLVEGGVRPWHQHLAARARCCARWKVRRRTIVLDAKVLLDKNFSIFLKR